jgi:hypothetical protein
MSIQTSNGRFQDNFLSITPLSLKQFFTMKKDFELGFAIHGFQVSGVKLVAQIVNILEFGTEKIVFQVKDGSKFVLDCVTGSLDDNLNKPLFDTLGKFYAMEQFAPNENTWCKIYGIFKCDERNHKRFLLVQNVETIQDFNEVTYHLLDIIETEEQCLQAFNNAQLRRFGDSEPPMNNKTANIVTPPQKKDDLAARSAFAPSFTPPPQPPNNKTGKRVTFAGNVITQVTPTRSSSYKRNAVNADLMDVDLLKDMASTSITTEVMAPPVVETFIPPEVMAPLVVGMDKMPDIPGINKPLWGPKK